MKSLAIVILVLGAFLTKSSFAGPIVGSCVKNSDPQSGTISVLFCGPPNHTVIYICDPNNTPPPTPGCGCPMDEPSFVTLPSSCEEFEP